MLRLGTVFIASLGAPAAAGEPPHWEDRHHTRHAHPHHDPHPAVHDPARFTTSRQSPIKLPLPGEEDAFFFVVYGDRTGGPAEGVAVLKDAVRDTNLLEPDLVMTVGDMIEGYTNSTDRWMSEMREYKSIMDELICPWFPVAGNHDTYWRPLGDPDMPANQHEDRYEMHFGPLWYAFEHKNCWFITLYTDEGNPETGLKSISRPDAQTMSPEQLVWLQETLGKASDADHVFVFVHHPRWRRGNYGDDWDKVHDVLVDAGNVSAVFAGHIHRMKYQEDDGIEYFTLATVGGHQGGAVPAAGQLHHFNVVTVRRDQIATAMIPVGVVGDPREMSDALTDGAAALAASPPAVDGTVSVAADGSALGRVRATVSNPSAFDVELALAPESQDGRWYALPDHTHATLAPGEERVFEFVVGRSAGALGGAYDDLRLTAHMELLTRAFRYPIPASASVVRADLRLHAPPRPTLERVLSLDGRTGYLEIPDAALDVPDGPLTIECWFRAERFADRVGLIAKTENSEYGIFLDRGSPEFSVHVGGRYRSASMARDVAVSTSEWHHIAGVFDGDEVRLYLGGRLIGRADASGPRRTNALPFLVGADVTGSGSAMSHFAGQIDALRISRRAVYSGARFVPERRPRADADTAALFNMDGRLGRTLIDQSDAAIPARLAGNATLVTPTP